MKARSQSPSRSPRRPAAHPTADARRAPPVRPDFKTESSPSVDLDIDTNRRLLNRYRFILHEGIHLMAGWFPAIATFELKCEIARVIWESAQHVNSLYLRLREIQSPAFQ